MLLGAFCSKLFKLKDDLEKTSCHDLKNERKSVPSNVPDPLAYALTHSSAFWSVEAYFYGENLILPYFSSLSMVAISVPFPEAQNRKGTESGLGSCSDSYKVVSCLTRVEIFLMPPPQM